MIAAGHKHIAVRGLLRPAVMGDCNAEKPVGQPVRDRKEHTSELQSHSDISYAVFCLKKKKFFNDTATTEIYTHSLHDALPIYFGGNTGKPNQRSEGAHV